ncbi:MAG: type III secretion system chaperone, partial [Chlamydiales bacterium]|nr:type III secretion system chaperone [Chlamydiales bacterium]
MLENLLQTLSHEMELEEKPLRSEKGEYSFKLSAQMQIHFQELDPGCRFFTQLYPLFDIRQEELFIYLMKANFLGQGTGEAVIALDEQEKFLTLSLSLPYDMNYASFKHALE